jgi:hypothetical protein
MVSTKMPPPVREAARAKSQAVAAAWEEFNTKLYDTTSATMTLYQNAKMAKDLLYLAYDGVLHKIDNLHAHYAVRGENTDAMTEAFCFVYELRNFMPAIMAGLRFMKEAEGMSQKLDADIGDMWKKLTFLKEEGETDEE